MRTIIFTTIFLGCLLAGPVAVAQHEPQQLERDLEKVAGAFEEGSGIATEVETTAAEELGEASQRLKERLRKEHDEDIKLKKTHIQQYREMIVVCQKKIDAYSARLKSDELDKMVADAYIEAKARGISHDALAVHMEATVRERDAIVAQLKEDLAYEKQCCADYEEKLKEKEIELVRLQEKKRQREIGKRFVLPPTEVYQPETPSSTKDYRKRIAEREQRAMEEAKRLADLQIEKRSKTLARNVTIDHIRDIGTINNSDRHPLYILTKFVSK